MKKYWHIAKPLIILLIFIAAAVLLYQELRQTSLEKIYDGFGEISLWRIAAAVMLTILNYIILVCYDLLAVRALPHPLPLRRIALASFAGNVCSFNFGSLLGGTSVRYRLYSGWNFSAVEIVRLMVMLTITFWIGMFMLAGICFIVQPFPIPEQLSLPFETVWPLGVLLLLATAVYLGLTLLQRRPWRIRGVEVRLPSTRLSLAQMTVAAADLMVAASALYVLVAPFTALNYFQFLGIYLLVIVVVTLTHVPGGVGVLEVMVVELVRAFEVVVHQLPRAETGPLLAGVLVFRVIYYLLPLMAAMVMLAVNEFLLHREAARRTFKWLERSLGPEGPTIVSMAGLVAGTLLLLSGALPIVPAQDDPLQRNVPLPAVEAAYFFGSLVGAALLLLARGLQRRLASAWWWTIGLLVLGICFSLLKGFRFEVVAVLLFLYLVVLIACRKWFYRPGSPLDVSMTPGWTQIILLAVVASLWLGLFTYNPDRHSWELWWSFSFRNDLARFLRSSIGVGGVLGLFVLLKLMRQPQRRRPQPDERQLVRAIVSKSPRALANLALVGDKSFLFNNERTAFVMYGIHGESWIVMGDPVGPPEEAPELVWNFRELCDDRGGRPVFFHVGQDSLPTYLDQGFTLLELAEEAWAPGTLQLQNHEPLLEIQQRFEDDGYAVEFAAADRVPALLPELRTIGADWLMQDGAGDIGFCRGRFDEEYLQNFPIALVRRSDRPVAFANLWPGAGKEELAIDLYRSVSDAPAELADFLLIELIQWAGREGYRWVQLGLAPPADRENETSILVGNRAAELVYCRQQHLAGATDIRRRLEKFEPIWKPAWLASPAQFELPQVVADIAALINRSRGRKQETMKMRLVVPSTRD